VFVMVLCLLTFVYLVSLSDAAIDVYIAYIYIRGSRSLPLANIESSDTSCQ